VSLVGKNIDAQCTKCKLLLAHVVMCEVGGAVSRVKCKTCGSEHKYRVKKVQTKKTAVAPRSRLGKASASRQGVHESPIRWKHKCSEMNTELHAKSYRIQDTYGSKDVIRHPLFGLGFVERVISETRMDVLFKDTVKLMAMNTRL
jgi:hypothetical protein